MPHLLHQMVQNRTNLGGHSIQMIIIITRARPHVVCGLVLCRSLDNYYYYLYRVSSKVSTVLNHLM